MILLALRCKPQDERGLQGQTEWLTHNENYESTFFQPKWQWLAKKGGMSEGDVVKTIVNVSIVIVVFVCWHRNITPAGFFYNNWYWINYSKIVKARECYVLVSYLRSFPTRFPLSSSPLSHSWSMHSVHSVPNLKLERSTFIGRSQIVSAWGRHRTRLCSDGTQNSNPSSWPTIHPSLIFGGKGSCSYRWVGHQGIGHLGQVIGQSHARGTLWWTGNSVEIRTGRVQTDGKYKLTTLAIYLFFIM